jgi:hypothetical protein
MAPEARWLKPIVRCWSGKLRVGCVGYETNAEPAARGMGSPHGCGTATTGPMGRWLRRPDGAAHDAGGPTREAWRQIYRWEIKDRRDAPSRSHKTLIPLQQIDCPRR